MLRRTHLRIATWFAASVLAVLLPVLGATYAALVTSIDRQIDVDIEESFAAFANSVQRLGVLNVDAPEDDGLALITGSTLLIHDRNGRFLGAAGEASLARQVTVSHAVAVALDGNETWLTVVGEQGRIRSLTRPVIVDGAVLGVVTSGRSLAFRDDRVALNRLVIGLAALAGLVLAPAAGWVVAGKALRPLEEARERENQFLADAAHELRSPLAVIKTSIDLLRRESDLSDRQVEYATTIAEVSDEATGFVDDLLTLAHATTAADRLAPSSCDLQVIVHQELTRLEPILAGRGHTVRAALAAAEVEMPERDVRRILRALLENVVAHSTPGEVTIETGADGRRAYLAVEDSGPGVEEKDLSRLFDRFFQTHAPRTPTPSRGAGLGLALVRAVAERYGGVAEASIGARGGLRVQITIPMG